MKNIILYLVCLTIVNFACKTNKIDYNQLSGTFAYINEKENFGYEYLLNLYPDQTFKFAQKYNETNPVCEGRWVINNIDELMLYCSDKESIEIILSRGYMHHREFNLLILNRDEIKMDSIIMRRISK
ncbi:hypothetical protein GGR21_004294 [Dysgonomonas hofstadii]|uniref:Uncharacterized protein n=1 Tax=Dysgonomonas hofstadii TaxID=637886 RepID=A0A840D0A0_9BACT|nr:hypothetical protein [Dysgonomonas hofstadii]MBB4038355.1 hypothetical protein [Dysgonomonas hofstadii]